MHQQTALTNKISHTDVIESQYKTNGKKLNIESNASQHIQRTRGGGWETEQH